ncbi:MAG: ABC transporter substrate-binding protein, partial [Neisseriaceae bacterium]|nr:ABC transporter substrate-binding protein [Neisseriaceae bacterium]
MKIKKIVSALTLLVASASAMAVGGTLVYCSEASPAGFDVAQLTSGTDFDAAARTMMDNLIAYKNGTTEMVPALAEKWDISEDGKTYTFHLRPNVKFHTTDYFKPTRDLQAEDVIFTFGRMIKKDHPSNKFYPAEYPYATDMALDTNIVSIKKIDNLTVEFKLKEVDAPFLAKLAMAFASIQSVEYAQQLASAGKLSELNQKPIGTGPFIFSSYEKDSTIRYNANKNYWNPAEVKVDKLIFSITKDASVRYQKLKKGECDILSYPSVSDLAEMKTDPALKVESAPGFNVGYVTYNTEKPEMKKPEVRQALDMVINRKAIIDAVYQGQGQEATNPFPPSLWSYNPALKNPPLDIEKAKALLAKAGYPNGFETDLWAMPVSRPYNPNGKLMAEMIQADW